MSNFGILWLCWRTQICDDSIGHAKAVHNVLDELDCFGCAVFCEWFVFDPLGELVNCYEDVLEPPFAFLRGPTWSSPQQEKGQAGGM